MEDETDLEPLLDQIRELSDLDLIRLLAYVAAEVTHRSEEAREAEDRRASEAAEDLRRAPWRRTRNGDGGAKGKGKGKRPASPRDGPY